MKDQIEAGLRELRASIKRMKELLEWKKLKEHEERGRRTPPSFRFQDRLESDMRIEEGMFWKTVSDILLVLGERDDEAATKARQRLVKLEEEMRELTARAKRLQGGENGLVGDSGSALAGTGCE